MGLPQDFQAIVCQREDAVVNRAHICLASIIRLLKVKYAAVILRGSCFLGIFNAVCMW